jgi:Flp pilus assembly protein TadB
MSILRLFLLLLTSLCAWGVILGALYQSPAWCVSAAVAGVLFAAAAMHAKPRRRARYYHPTIPPRL